MSQEIFLSIVIPAYNEAKRVPKTLKIIINYLQKGGNPSEILVVDDGSTDETLSAVQELQKANPVLRVITSERNRGKGYAVRQGSLAANGKYILITDADLSTPIEEFDRFLTQLAKGIPVVIGTRKHNEAQILQHQPLWREFMGKGYTWVSNVVLGLHVSDFTCGFKAFEQKAARQLFSQQRINRWAFDSEVLFLAGLGHYQVAEVPVRWQNSPETKVRILKDTLVSFLSLFAVRINLILGRYARQAEK